MTREDWKEWKGIVWISHDNCSFCRGNRDGGGGARVEVEVEVKEEVK